MRLGGVIPWIGFRRAKVPCEVAAEMGLKQAPLVEGSMNEVWVETFDIEWFNCGITLAMKAAVDKRRVEP